MPGGSLHAGQSTLHHGQSGPGSCQRAERAEFLSIRESRHPFPGRIRTRIGTHLGWGLDPNLLPGRARRGRLGLFRECDFDLLGISSDRGSASHTPNCVHTGLHHGRGLQSSTDRYAFAHVHASGTATVSPKVCGSRTAATFRLDGAADLWPGPGRFGGIAILLPFSALSFKICRAS